MNIKTDMPRFCPEIQTAIEERNYWHKRKRDFHNSEFVITRFKEMHSLVTNLIRFYKKRFYTSVVNVNINNLKKLWQLFNELIYSRTRVALNGVSKIYDSFNNLVTGEIMSTLPTVSDRLCFRLTLVGQSCQRYIILDLTVFYTGCRDS
jgi:hypothetical protein